jgi:hypothetical protein
MRDGEVVRVFFLDYTPLGQHQYLGSGRGKIKRYFLIAVLTMQSSQCSKLLPKYLSTPTFEQRSQSSNGYAIRLYIVTQGFLLSRKTSRPFQLGKFT